MLMLIGFAELKVSDDDRAPRGVNWIRITHVRFPWLVTAQL